MKLLLVATLALALAACGGKSKTERSEEPTLPLPVTAPTENSVPEESVTASEPVAVATPAAEPYVAPPVEVVGESEETLQPKIVEKPKAVGATGVSADKALGWLRNGNSRFVKRKVRADGQSAKDRTRVATAQKPHSVIFSCSDSRVPPEIIFDQKLGEIYVVRNEGLTVDSAAIASLENAVNNVGTKLVVVLGHDDCSATSNAADIANFIVTKSAALADKVTSGSLIIQPATYNLKSGAVEFLK